MVPSVISVTVPASDLSLLTIGEMRAAVGVTDNKSDTAVKRIGEYVADALTQACKLPTDGITPPTLRLETIVETFRLNRWWNRRNHPGVTAELILGRRPIVSVLSVVEAGVTLDPDCDFEINAGAGMLLRLFGDGPSHWVRGKIVVTYTAGWAVVPVGLKRAAAKLMAFYWSEASKDPLLRSINILGVSEKNYWIGAASDPSIPQDVMDDLGPYINPLV